MPYLHFYNGNVNAEEIFLGANSEDGLAPFIIPLMPVPLSPSEYIPSLKIYYSHFDETIADIITK